MAIAMHWRIEKSGRRVSRRSPTYAICRLEHTRPGQRASGSTTKSGRPSLVNAFLKAVTRGELPGQWPCTRIAEFLTAWDGPSRSTPSNRPRNPAAHPRDRVLSAEDLRFARVVYHEHPDRRLGLCRRRLGRRTLWPTREHPFSVNPSSSTIRVNASLQTPMIRMDGSRR